MTTAVEYIETPFGVEAVCKECGSDVYWQECWNCREGYSHHDCGEDTCNCLVPELNVKCDICNGNGGWYLCHSCTVTSKELRKLET